MPKTPDQQKADNLFEEGVQAVIKAYDLIPAGALVTDYVVVGEAMKFAEDDDDSICHMFYAYRNGNMKITTVIGMIELARHHFKSGHESG